MLGDDPWFSGTVIFIAAALCVVPCWRGSKIALRYVALGCVRCKCCKKTQEKKVHAAPLSRPCALASCRRRHRALGEYE